MSIALKAVRGTKRRCQNDGCGLPFYDLNRGTIVCPNCASVFVEVEREAPRMYRGKPARVFPIPHAPAEVSPEVAIDEVADDGAAIAPAEGEALLEVDDEDGDQLSAEVALDDEPQTDE